VPGVIREWAEQNGHPLYGLMIPELTRKAYAKAHNLGYVPIPSVRELQEHAARIAAERDEKLAQLYAPFRDDPSAFIRDGSYYPPDALFGADARKRFRHWLGHDFYTWQDRVREALIQAGADEREVTFFEGEWHPEGSDAYYHEKHMERVWELVELTAAETRLQVTEELLGTKFALGDGTKVTWGEATVEQHRQYVVMLSGQVAGTVETAARHEAAIRLCEEAGVSCLGELDSQPESGAA
jgi:hypothetical protein